MNAGQIELAKSYITWMRRGNTLSLDGYYPMNNGKWTVFKVIGSPKEYKAYRENNYNPLRRMCAPDDAVLIEKYR